MALAAWRPNGCRKPRLPIALIMSRSWVSRYLAISQPPLSSPTSWSRGTTTSSKKVSQNGDLPEISTIGRVVTPGVSMSNSRKLMPVCFCAEKSVRTRQKIQSALSAYEVQIFWPLTTKWSPRSSARVCSAARSEPAFGSE